jgi:bifunctional enzyme CysN/CysC
MATCEPAPGVAQVKLVIVGHVDHGKSTLIGRLFHDTGSLQEGKYEQLVAAADRRGVAFEFANLMDALQAERDQNITIDTSHIWFRWKERRYVIIDAPGHKEFVKNMVTGAARADAAVVIIDAHEGVQEQSRRHGFLLTLLGIDQVMVVVNKMDLVGCSQAAFQKIADEYSSFLGSIGVTPLAVLPASARSGDNVVTRAAALGWYKGPTVLEALALLRPAPPLSTRALRFPIQDIYRFDHRRILAGRIESGVLRVGDRIQFLPSGKQSVVKTIERWNSPAEASATAGESIGVTLTEQLFIDRGDVACGLVDTPYSETEFDARVFWLGKRPLVRGRRYLLRLATQEVECEIGLIKRVIDAATLAEHSSDDGVSGHDVADVTILTRRPLVYDTYGDVPTLGRFVLVDQLDVAGGGIVTRAARPARVPATAVPANLTRSISQVTRDERYARNRHKGAVVWFTGLSGSGKSTLANALERELFDRGLQVFVLDGDNIRHGLSANLGFSAADRAENIRRVAETAKLFAEAGIIVITAFISPYRSDRVRARYIMQEGGVDIPFSEVYLDAPLDVCEQRDPKHLYARARAGEIKGFTGISAPYEPPEAPELIIRTDEYSIDKSVAAVLDHLVPRIA